MVVDETQFLWIYISPNYQMFQENRLQVFKLPKPVLCNEHVLLVELHGRAQKQGLLYYIGISHIQAVGLLILAAFKEIRHRSGKYILKYCPSIRVLYSSSSSSSCWMKYGIVVMFIFMMMFLPLAHFMALTDK
ncbi:hypothetical protein MtrunA17_Chr6g0472891 [Medicago truncatula]|uniref:Transmembrane protein n=2 Tax=Medicago truncatula TaxID=3880 RepID=A0A396HKK3_MEDTR|nr:hypothetical protein MtrunA17_Chr6g0472891 [Medicago truncatula]